VSFFPAIAKSLVQLLSFHSCWTICQHFNLSRKFRSAQSESRIVNPTAAQSSAILASKFIANRCLPLARALYARANGPSASSFVVTLFSGLLASYVLECIEMLHGGARIVQQCFDSKDLPDQLCKPLTGRHQATINESGRKARHGYGRKTSPFLHPDWSLFDAGVMPSGG
jgi:hypothetical protein